MISQTSGTLSAKKSAPPTMDKSLTINDMAWSDRIQTYSVVPSSPSTLLLKEKLSALCPNKIAEIPNQALSIISIVDNIPLFLDPDTKCLEELQIPCTQPEYPYRHRLWSKFDEGVLMDEAAWYEVTPEVVSRHIGERIASPEGVIIDGCCGVGCSTITFTNYFALSVGVDISPSRIDVCRHNAEIYGVLDRVSFFTSPLQDFADRLIADGQIFEQGRGGEERRDETGRGEERRGEEGVGFAREEVDAIFISPPWGGRASNKGEFLLGDKDLVLSLFDACRRIANPHTVLAFHMPKSMPLEEILLLTASFGYRILMIDRLIVADNSICKGFAVHSQLNHNATVMYFTQEISWILQKRMMFPSTYEQQLSAHHIAIGEKKAKFYRKEFSKVMSILRRNKALRKESGNNDYLYDNFLNDECVEGEMGEEREEKEEGEEEEEMYLRVEEDDSGEDEDEQDEDEEEEEEEEVEEGGEGEKGGEKLEREEKLNTLSSKFNLNANEFVPLGLLSANMNASDSIGLFQSSLPPSPTHFINSSPLSCSDLSSPPGLFGQIETPKSANEGSSFGWDSSVCANTASETFFPANPPFETASWNMETGNNFYSPDQEHQILKEFLYHIAVSIANYLSETRDGVKHEIASKTLFVAFALLERYDLDEILSILDRVGGLDSLSPPIPSPISSLPCPALSTDEYKRDYTPRESYFFHFVSLITPLLLPTLFPADQWPKLDIPASFNEGVRRLYVRNNSPAASHYLSFYLPTPYIRLSKFCRSFGSIALFALAESIFDVTTAVSMAQRSAEADRERQRRSDALVVKTLGRNAATMEKKAEGKRGGRRRGKGEKGEKGDMAEGRRKAEKNGRGEKGARGEKEEKGEKGEKSRGRRGGRRQAKKQGNEVPTPQEEGVREKKPARRRRPPAKKNEKKAEAA